MSLVRGSLFDVNVLDVAVARVAARQRSLVHRDQARALGMTLRQFQTRTRSGLYVRSQPNVVRLAAAPESWEQQVLAACLSVGHGAVRRRTVARRSSGAFEASSGRLPRSRSPPAGAQGWTT